MKKVFVFTFLLSLHLSLSAQHVLNLDSCRALAIANNKELLISNEKISAAHNTHKAASTNFLPNLSASGSYIRSQKEFSMLSDQQKAELPQLGTALGGSLNQIGQAIAPQNPSFAQGLGVLGQALGPGLNQFGQSVVDAFRTDTRNMYVGALTLTQPIYMGGKIRAYNQITKYAEELAIQQHNIGLQEVILNSDQAYWQVVSLANKKKLAESYLNLLKQLEGDIDKMIAQGVVTKADGLSVKVKVNEAEMTLTKVEDGLSLSKMLLCQICGLDLSKPISLADEQIDDLPMLTPANSFDMNTAYANRLELKSLDLANKIYKQKITITRAEHLPSLAFVGNYIVSNPSMFNGFQNKFGGMWNVGVVLQVPIWHWGEGKYKVRAAQAEARMTQYQIQDAKEKIELQVNQALFKVNEAMKKLTMSNKNMEKAEENLRYALIGFKEGIIVTSNVLEAQTAWLSAKSEKIDAQIDVKLTELYLKKSLGTIR